MLEFEAFNEVMNEIMSLGYSEEEAAHFAQLIGDMPVFDEEGFVLVTDWATDKVLARLKLRSVTREC